MRAIALRLVELVAPTRLAENLVGDFEESRAGAWEIARSIPHLVRPRLGRAALAMTVAWVPLAAMESLVRYIQSQVPLKTGPEMPWPYLAAAVAASAAFSLAILKKERQP